MFMIFNRTYRFKTPLSITEAKDRLVNKHFMVHHLDFEVLDKQQLLKIIPHAENSQNLKTLPITHVEMQGLGNTGTRVIVTAKPRKIDVGGPYLIVIFCLFCIIGGSLFYYLYRTERNMESLVMVGIGLLIFILFWVKMETGYFDYIRKIKSYVHTQLK
jgi:hypothetical protein